MIQNSLLWSFQTTSINIGMFTLESMINRNNYAPINRRGGGGGGEGGHRHLQSNSLPTGKSLQSITTKFPNPWLHIAVKYPKAEPKKGTIKISPNKTLQSLSILRCCTTEDTCSVTAAIISFNHNPCYILRRIQKPFWESLHFVSLNILFLVKGMKKVNFISLQWL